MATLDTVDLQTAVDVLTTEETGVTEPWRVVDILQKQATNQTGKDAWYCTVRTNYNDATYGLLAGKSCWVQTTEASNAATQAAELLAGLGAVAVRNGPVDPDVFGDV